MREQYDFSNAVRGKYAKRFREGVRLPELASADAIAYEDLLEEFVAFRSWLVHGSLHCLVPELGVVLGGMLGTFVAFGREYVRRQRGEDAEELRTGAPSRAGVDIQESGFYILYI